MIYTIKDISALISPIAIKYGIPHVFLFGSYARGDATDQSDIDLLIDTEGTELNSLFSLGSLYVELEDAFNKPIDLITVSSLLQRPQMMSDTLFKETVLHERINIYDVA